MQRASVRADFQWRTSQNGKNIHFNFSFRCSFPLLVYCTHCSYSLSYMHTKLAGTCVLCYVGFLLLRGSRSHCMDGSPVFMHCASVYTSRLWNAHSLQQQQNQKKHIKNHSDFRFVTLTVGYLLFLVEFNHFDYNACGKFVCFWFSDWLFSLSHCSFAGHNRERAKKWPKKQAHAKEPEFRATIAMRSCTIGQTEMKSIYKHNSKIHFISFRGFRTG